MGATTSSQKNMPLSVVSLGLGDQLAQQVDDEEDERRKKLLANSETGGMMSPAVMSLFGPQGAGGARG